MDKATKTIQCEFPDGTATIVITESRELCLRAYETARLFGFRDAKECIRNYAEGRSRLFLRQQEAISL